MVAFGGNWVVSVAGFPLKMLDELLCLMAAVNGPDEKKVSFSLNDKFGGQW